MPTSADPDVLVDTSVALPLMIVDHEAHESVTTALDGLVLGLAGHAAFETISVLTRLPAPLRRSPASSSELLRENFPRSRFLTSEETLALLRSLAEQRVSGGAVYDALVGWAALKGGRRLATRDSRALSTYRKLAVQVWDLNG